MVVHVELKTQATISSVMRDAIWGFEDELILAIADRMIKCDIGAVAIMRQSMPIGIITERASYLFSNFIV